MRRDWPLWFFAVAAGASLLVSLPATSAAMQLTHGGGWWVAAVAVFEIGAVGLELMTLAVPQWRGRLLVGTVALLTLTTGANYAAGADALAAAPLPAGSTYAAVRAAGWGGALALGLSALFPALLFAFLLGLTARWRMLARWQDRDMCLSSRERAVTAREQAFEQAAADLTRREQAAGARWRDEAAALAAREQAVTEREQAPIRVEQVETVRVARHALTWPQLAQLVAEARRRDATSVSSLRRLVADGTTEEGV